MSRIQKKRVASNEDPFFNLKICNLRVSACQPAVQEMECETSGRNETNNVKGLKNNLHTIFGISQTTASGN